MTIELPISQKELIIISAQPTTINCDECNYAYYFEHPPSEDYICSDCGHTIIKWV